MVTSTVCSSTSTYISSTSTSTSNCTRVLLKYKDKYQVLHLWF